MRHWGNEPFLGTRIKDEQGKAGPYQWQTYAEINTIAEDLARSLKIQDLCPDIDENGKTFRFCGIWAKNRWEWHTTLLACMHYKITTVGFYDA